MREKVDERRNDRSGSHGLVHLAACCVGGGAAVLAVYVVQWLT